MSLTTNATFTHLQSYLDKHTTAYQETMEKLSSGNKYSSISKNPVDVGNAKRLEVQIKTSNTANANAELGNDLLATASDAQENIISNLQAIRDLCLEAANGTYSTSDKDEFLQEIRARLDYINSKADNTDFNDINILDGSASTCSFQIGTSSSSRIKVGDALIDVHTSALDININDTESGSTWNNTDIANYINKIDTATKTLISTSSKLGAYANRLDTVSETLTNMSQNLTAKKSIISDADVAESSADLVKNQILQQASVSILVQVNNMQSLALSLFNS